jgi:pimeloyl-ACP methyl ester carboxylesterase
MEVSQVRKWKLLWLGALAALLALPTFAQEIAGDWQGTVKAPGGELRLIVKIGESASGGWKATVYSIDQSPDPVPVSSVTLLGSNLTLNIEAVRGTYEGKLSADGNAISGTWNQGGAFPLELRRATKQTAWQIDPSNHKVQFVNVEPNVRLEVLDWGGSGRPVVLLAGLGDNAHVYDDFAPKLTASYHVYGLTRRGFGASSVPDSGYSADRLGDDVLAVISALKLNRPVLVGHSLAGEELSSVGSRHPEKVAGLVYLDAAYGYAYYDRSRGDLNIDLSELEAKLEAVRPGKARGDTRPTIQELLATSIPAIQRDLQEMQKDLDAMPAAMLNAQNSAPAGPSPAQAIMAGAQKYTNIPVPVLAIYALPHDLGQAITDPAVRAKMEARDEAATGAQAKAFENGVRSARVVRLPHASHYVFRSNEADVLREMSAFIGKLR